jgi:hypothetical protein
MKIKKLLPLVLLAVTAVLMLSSCDAMLDAIFPSDQISVDVMVNKHTLGTDFYSDWYYGAPSTVSLTLYDVTAGGASTNQVSGWTDIDSNSVHYVFTFPNLKDHVYTMKATYHSYTSGFYYGPNYDFFDGSINLIAGVHMPYRTGHDSTGHSADFQMYF